ncbi:MAG: N-formylglutamate amidohydrolase [Alteromonadaceae bacterium]|nr:N-formylglutamate amidohydrolase [Alteromonadaceae bacterium]
MDITNQSYKRVKRWGLFSLLAIAFLQAGCTAPETTTMETAGSQPPQFDESWLDTVQGNMPLVISAPHGGTIKPEGIADKDCGAKVMDNNTADLAFEIKNAFAKYGKTPHLIVARIARAKIDLNRDKDVATCEKPLMGETWEQYHQAVERALEQAIDEFGYAMYIDLHGQSHPVKRLELGYLLKTPALTESYEAPQTNPERVEQTSLRNVLRDNDKLSLETLFTGEKALGTLLADAGFPAVPSQSDPYPQEGEPYFTGGYNTRRYTSADYPKVFGLQIEANYDGVRDSEENREKFSAAFALSVNEYLMFIEANSNW